LTEGAAPAIAPALLVIDGLAWIGAAAVLSDPFGFGAARLPANQTLDTNIGNDAVPEVGSR
jgi:hypothetical protein